MISNHKPKQIFIKKKKKKVLLNTIKSCTQLHIKTYFYQDVTRILFAKVDDFIGHDDLPGKIKRDSVFLKLIRFL